MLEAVAAAIQATTLSQTLRSSIWLYPLVNAGHVIGIALLFGSIVPLDLRLLGRQADLPLGPFARALIPVAIAGLLLAVSTGLLMFATKPLDYVVEPLFAIKLGLLTLAIVNALALHRRAQWGLMRSSAPGPVPAGWKWAALASLMLWLGVILAGRLIGYR